MSLSLTAASASDLAAAYCGERLDVGYADIVRGIVADAHAVGVLARGRDRSWAAGAVRFLGHANVLWDGHCDRPLTTGEIATAFGVTVGTVSSKGSAIARALDHDAGRSQYVHPDRAEAVAAYALTATERRHQQAGLRDSLADRGDGGEGWDDCPFHDRWEPEPAFLDTLDGPQRHHAVELTQARAELSLDTGLGRCLDSALGLHLRLLGVDGPEWGHDAADDDRLIARELRRLRNGQRFVETVSDNAELRSTVARANTVSDFVHELATLDWQTVRVDELAGQPTESQLHAFPNLRLPAAAVFLDMEDGGGHPAFLPLDDDLDIGVHGAFIQRPEPDVLVVAPILSIAPDVLYPEDIRVPCPPVSYSSRDTPPELDIWCELHVDCRTARVHDTMTELVAAHTHYGRNVEIAGIAADCALMTLQRSGPKPPPPPPRKRPRRKR